MDHVLTDKDIEALVAPEKGNKIFYDSEVKGFGVRVTSAGAKSFILNYRQNGRERRLTIGSYPDWKIKPDRKTPGAVGARDHAKGLKQQIDLGADPMADRTAEREAPTVATLADRFEKEHVVKRRPTTREGYNVILKNYIRPKLGKMRLADLRHADIERLHVEIARDKPYQANRCVAVLSKMLSLAIKWELRADNPAKGIERANEQRRERYLSAEEIARLGKALSGLREKASANAIRLLLLTGARKSEVLKARWSEFDLQAGVWTKPSAHTKQKKDHRLPLSAPARLLLTELRAEADKEIERGGSAEYLFPNDDPKAPKPINNVKKSWATVCKTAGLGKMVPKLDAKSKQVLGKDGSAVMVFKADARMHDLRHTFASILVGHGLSLPIIGSLLGHSQPATTARYAHLADDPLRAATEKVGALVSGASQPAPAKPASLADERRKRRGGR